MSKRKPIPFYRQGDVIIIPVDALPDEAARPISRDAQDRIVLAEGEVTGHAHAVKDIDVKWIEIGRERYLSSDKPFVVEHDEHSALTLPAGNYIVGVQVEYDPEQDRIVLD